MPVAPPCSDDAVAAGPGVCISPGIAPEDCATGFEPDGARGCTPILPPGPCAPGTMALPGETTCREVAPCPAAPFGDLPAEPGIQHVSAAHTGASDGSPTQPWRTLSEGIAAAAHGAIVAVADGEYAEAVTIGGKPVRLWGRCPGSVVVRAPPGEMVSIFVASGASGTEIRRLALTGPAAGVVVSGSESVLLEALWVHDTQSPGVVAQDVYGPTSIIVRGSLVEHNVYQGIYVTASGLVLEDTVVRDSQPTTAIGTGPAVFASDLGGSASTVEVRRIVIERSALAGLVVFGSSATVRESVVRDIAPAPGVLDGWGLAASQGTTNGAPASLAVETSVIERATRVGLVAFDSSLTVDRTVVRDVQPLDDGINAYGWSVLALSREGRASTTLRASLFERATEGGVVLFGADALVETSIIRDVNPSPSLERGVGLNAQTGETGEPTLLTFRESLIERAHEQSLLVVGSDATVDGSVVRDTLRSALDGLHGDAIAIVTLASGPASATRIARARIERSARAGITAFGAHAELGSTILDCNQIDLNGESYHGVDFTFTDLGGNSCGCADTKVTCAARSAGLQPPEPLN
jgi:hypothetical protein